MRMRIFFEQIAARPAKYGDICACEKKYASLPSYAVTRTRNMAQMLMTTDEVCTLINQTSSSCVESDDICERSPYTQTMDLPSQLCTILDEHIHTPCDMVTELTRFVVFQGRTTIDEFERLGSAADDDSKDTNKVL